MSSPHANAHVGTAAVALAVVQGAFGLMGANAASGAGEPGLGLLTTASFVIPLGAAIAARTSAKSEECYRWFIGGLAVAVALFSFTCLIVGLSREPMAPILLIPALVLETIFIAIITFAAGRNVTS